MDKIEKLKAALTHRKKLDQVHANGRFIPLRVWCMS